MRSPGLRSRNHFLSFTGKGAQAIMCNHDVTDRVLRYP
jgi:hypothetical protein